MGVVYEAVDGASGAHVALKTLRADTAQGLLRLKREFRALQDLHHPNLVRYGELIEHDRHWFLTMELVNGADFLTFVRGGRGYLPRCDVRAHAVTETSPGTLDTASETPLAPPADLGRLRESLAQLAEGLTALHLADRVHRDVKPSNILVDATGRVVLLDFGLVTETFSAAAWSGHNVVGTAAYMAPEQAASGIVGPAADWYSVGVMLYEALTGRLPYAGPDLRVLIDKQQRDPVSPRRLSSDAPADLNELCMEMLQFDPMDRPAGSEILSRLFGRAHAFGTASRSTATRSVEIVGREVELRELQVAFDSVRNGAAVTVFVEGESGVGKSALVQQFVKGLSDDNRALALYNRCYERAAHTYTAIDGIVDAIARYVGQLPATDARCLAPRRAALLADVFPVLRTVPGLSEGHILRVPDPLEHRQFVFRAMGELLGRLADGRPVVVVIDDFHWADADSIALLRDVLQPPDAPQLLLIALWRNLSGGEGGDDAAPPALPGDTRRLVLERLSADDAERLAAHVLGLAAPADRARFSAQAALIARESAGHPLFIEELVRYTVAQSHVARGDAQPSALVDLDTALWNRVAALPAAARTLLEVVCLAGQPTPTGTAARAARVEPDELSRWTSLLAVNRLTRSGTSRGVACLEPYHDRVMRCVLNHVREDVRLEHHRAIARALAALPNPDPEALAKHYAAGGEPERAAEPAERAADAAAAGLAFDRAAQLYQDALAWSGADGAAARSLYARLGDALANAGRGRDAARAYVQAVPGATEADALDMQRRAADQLLRSGHIDAGLDTLRGVLADVGIGLPTTPRRALWSLLRQRAAMRVRGLGFRERDASCIADREIRRVDTCWSAATGLSLVDVVRAADFQARHLRLALRTGESYRVARAIAVEVAHRATAGDRAHPQCSALLEHAYELADRAGHPHGRALVVLVDGVANTLRGRFRDAETLLGRALTLLREECTGVAWELGTARQFQMWCLFYLGDMKRMSALVLRHARVALAAGDRYAAATLRLAPGNIAWLMCDEPDSARREADDAIESWSRRGFHVQHINHLMSSADIDLYSGDAARAHGRFVELWPAVRRSLLTRVQNLRVLVVSSRGRSALAAATTGEDGRRLLALAGACVRKLRREAVPWARGYASLLAAGIACQSGQQADAISWLRDAVGEFTTAHMALYIAAANACLGKLIGGDHGGQLQRDAFDWMASEHIVEPRRMVAMLAPGFGVDT